jgi:Fe-S cluster assembly iron-binding protein IscA
MLSITSDGAAAIRQLVDSTERLPGAVLRIVRSPAGGERAQLALVLSRPRQNDLVVSERGISVYFEPELATRLDGKHLDARSETGRTRFVVR